MREVIEKIVNIEKDVDKIILSAREKATALLAKGDTENSARLQEAKARERERVASLLAEAESRQAEEIKAAVESAQAKYDHQENDTLVEELAEKVTARITQTVFDQ